MRDASASRSWICFLAVALGAFAFFYAMAGRYPWLFDGHDHWVTGHGMLLSDAYLHAGFRTPWLLPVEDAYGPVGAWAPYTGWPPLFFVVLAVWRLIFGPSLATARLFFCGVTAISAGLVALMALRATRDRWFVLFTAVAFCTCGSIVRYCAFGFSDTGALAASLLVVFLYPGYVASESRAVRAAFLALVATTGFISWQCFVAPVACAAAHLVTARPAAPRARLLAPIAAAAAAGVALLLYYGRAEAAFEPNGWVAQASLGEKFLLRTGWSDPRGALGLVADFAKTVAWQALPLALATLVLVAAARVFRRSAAAEAEGPSGADPRLGAFYAAATGLQALLWGAFMPNMHLHDFQGIFWAAPLALASTLLVREALRWAHALGSAGGRAVLVGASLALAAPNFVAAGALDRSNAKRFAALERDVRAASTPATVVVTSIDDRGFWWRVGRPVIALRRIARARGRDHLVVIGAFARAPGEEYKRIGIDGGYAIWRPRPASTPR